MEFRDKQAIYMQIADFFINNILKGIWETDEKVPSIRQLAVDLEVNPNTVMRTYTYLQEKEIIYNKRGLGYFVTPEAKQVVKEIIKSRFIYDELPEVFGTMEILGFTAKDIDELFNEWKNKKNEN